nr:somatomedin-B and thrombospondin type-1 domain-containing protein-like [Panthera onca]
MPATMCLVLLLLLWLSCATPNQETGSCSQPQPLCCFGTDHHCKRGSCYCDEFCHEVSDCCPDHRALCTLDNSHAGSFPPLAEPDAVMDRGKPLACTSGQGQDVDWMPPEGPDNPEILTFGPFRTKSAHIFLPALFPHCS